MPKLNTAGQIRDSQAVEVIVLESVEIGPLFAGAEQNEDGLIPTYASTITKDELMKLRFNYNISSYIELRISSEDQTLYNPPKGFFLAFSVQIENGWRLPIHPDLQMILREILMCPT